LPLLPSFFLLLLGVTKELDEERPPVSNPYPTPYEGALARLTSDGSIKPLKLVQIVVTVFVPAFNETFLAASACKSISPSPGKGERTKYQTMSGWVRRAYEKSKQTMSVEDGSSSKSNKYKNELN
jgi:hypothetical protein